MQFVSPIYYVLSYAYSPCTLLGLHPKKLIIWWTAKGRKMHFVQKLWSYIFLKNLQELVNCFPVDLQPDEALACQDVVFLRKTVNAIKRGLISIYVDLGGFLETSYYQKWLWIQELADKPCILVVQWIHVHANSTIGEILLL